jgi:uncharacterized protein (DUF433 family)
VADLTDARLTVPEAAFVAGLTVKDINREIDANIVPTEGGAERKLRGGDLMYLFAIREVRTQVDPSLRRRIRKAIVDALRAHQSEARVYQFVFALDAIRRDLRGPFEILERSKSELIERRRDVLAGEPVIRGTRIAARHVADLLRLGASPAEIGEDLDLTAAQIEAAAVFAQTTPKRGRPPIRKQRTVHVPAA